MVFYLHHLPQIYTVWLTALSIANFEPYLDYSPQSLIVCFPRISVTTFYCVLTPLVASSSSSLAALPPLPAQLLVYPDVCEREFFLRELRLSFASRILKQTMQKSVKFTLTPKKHGLASSPQEANIFYY